MLSCFMEKARPLPSHDGPLVVPADGQHARMTAYAQSEEGRSRIAKAQSEIDAGLGIVADDAYFAGLGLRIGVRVAKERSSKA